MTIESDRLFLTELLKDKKPFIFARFGDSEFMCMNGRAGENSSGQPFSKRAGQELISAFNYFTEKPNAYLSKWCLESDVDMALERVQFSKSHYIDHDALILHSLSPSLADFYRALVADSRKRVLVGNGFIKAGAQVLACDEFIEVQKPDAYAKRDKVFSKTLKTFSPGSVYLFCASFLGKILSAHLSTLDETITCIDLGSALDPLYIGHTRSGQVSKERAMGFFSAVTNVE